jgi:hypothetical protein
MTRRIVLCSFAVATLVALTMSRVAIAQVDWTWQAMVVPPGEPGDWDSYRHQVGDIVFDGTTYHMYLSGGETFLPWDSPWAVGHWTWNALTQEWDPDPNNPVLTPEPGQWDGYTIYTVAVLDDGGIFKMWYGAAANSPDTLYTGYATSDDGSEWEKYPGNPLPGLEPGVPGEWDDGGWSAGTVLFDGASYHLWSTVTKVEGPVPGTWRIGYATSPDGLVWTKHPEPVLVGSAPWEDNRVYLPEVVPMGGGYAMWYSAVVAGGEAAIGYAVSPDGIHWGRWPGNPVLTPSCPDNVIESLNVIIEGDTIHGWVSNCRDVWNLISQLEVVFFDAFETGDISIWSTVVP